MTYPSALQKARQLAHEHGRAVLVSVADPAHCNGAGENRFDAVTREVFARDKQAGRYLTLEELVTKEGSGE
jgi:hypothetical protein